MSKIDTLGLTRLGLKVDFPESPETARLERVSNSQTGASFFVRFTTPEFASPCPLTGQPDFAHLVIDYAPDKWLVESRSLELYLGAFRNHGRFHEYRTGDIGKKLAGFPNPGWLRIGGRRHPCGGIPIDVFRQTGQPPEYLRVPSQGVAPYCGGG